MDERVRARQQAVSTILTTLTWATLGAVLMLGGVASLVGALEVRADHRRGIARAVRRGVVGAVSVRSARPVRRDEFAQVATESTRNDAGQPACALQDVSRLSTRYGQFLAWCRALGAVLRAPFRRPARRSAPLGNADGLPRCTQIGLADPGADKAGDAIHAIRRRFYALGWLTQPWQDLVGDAAGRLREEPEALPDAGIGTVRAG